MKITIKIVTDEEVFRLLDSKQFISAWNELSFKDKKVTVIQERPFVLTWYFQYSSVYKPILVLGYDESNQLVGLMPLAFSLKDKYLTHAGDGQAEYHGWISKEDIDQDFPIQALIAIKKLFKIKKWKWRWTPPKAKNEWIFSPLLTKNNIYVKFRRENSPRINLKNDERLRKLRKNKTIKNQFNQLKQKGGFHIERITDKEKLKKLIDVIVIQCDFRHAATHQVAPFERDDIKRNFYIARMNYPSNNHFTVLWLENKILAYNYGACDSDTVYLGLTSFDPLEARNSPGNLFILELADFITKEGYSFLDLTPGGDKYKKRFCNEYQELVETTFYFNLIEKKKADLHESFINILKKCFILFGINKDIVKNKIANLKDLAKRFTSLTLSKLLKKIISLIYEKHEYMQYYITSEIYKIRSLQEDNNINIQKYSDLLLHKENNVARDKLLSEALKRFIKGETLYTIVQNGVLAHYGWMVKGGKVHRLMPVDMEFKSPLDSIVLYDFYTNPQFRKQGLYTKNLQKMICDSFNLGAQKVYIGVLSQNTPSKKVIEKSGFIFFRRYKKTRLLWKIKKEMTNE